MRNSFLLPLTFILLLASPARAQEPAKERKVLKNADIVSLVQNQFADETVEEIIEASDTEFDISADALIALKNQGVSSSIIRAMLQATQKKRHDASEGASSAANPAPAPDAPSPGSAAPAAPAPAAPPPDSSAATAPARANPPKTDPGGDSSAKAQNPPLANQPNQPTPTPNSTPAPPNPMAGMQGMGAGMGMNPQQLAALQSQLAMMGMGGMASMFGGNFAMNYSPEQLPHVFLMGELSNKTKQEIAPAMAQMAQTKLKTGAPSPGGMALRSLATQGLSFAAMGGGPAGMMAMSAFSMASGFMPGMRPGTPSMTYVWGLPGRKSARELTNKDPIFELNYGDIPGVDPDAFEPAILRLTQTPDNYRLVGATRTKLNTKNMMAGNGLENGKWIAEDRWPTRVYKEDRGFYVLRVDQPLEPGEYAVVLRPVKGYKATSSGLGGHAQVFYSVWDFSVPGAAPADTNKKKKK